VLYTLAARSSALACAEQLILAMGVPQTTPQPTLLTAPSDGTSDHEVRKGLEVGSPPAARCVPALCGGEAQLLVKGRVILALGDVLEARAIVRVDEGVEESQRRLACGEAQTVEACEDARDDGARGGGARNAREVVADINAVWRLLATERGNVGVAASRCCSTSSAPAACRPLGTWS